MPYHAVIHKPLAIAADGVLFKISTELPREIGSKPNAEVVEGPGTHNNIVNVYIEPYKKHAIAKTLKTA